MTLRGTALSPEDRRLHPHASTEDGLIGAAERTVGCFPHMSYFVFGKVGPYLPLREWET